MTKRSGSDTTIEPYTKMSADIYDAGNTGKNYEAEAATLKKLIAKYKQSAGNELLDVACGTGLHLPYLVDDYKVTGVDLSEQQLEGARKRLPHVNFVQGDIRDFDLHHQFDVVTCLFSGIGYVYPYKEMAKAIKNMASHLKTGGVLLVEPYLQPDAFDPNQPAQKYVSELPDKQLKITVVIDDFRLDGNISSMKMHHIVEKPGGVEEFTEEHRVALYTAEEFQKAFMAAGLSVQHDQQGLDGRGLFIGINQP